MTSRAVPLCVALMLIMCTYVSSSISSSVSSSINDIESAPSFGHDMLKYFYMKPGYWNMNHGAFGTVCRDAAAAEQNYYTEMESDANIWYRGVYQAYLDNVRTLLSKYVNAKQSDLVLVENASSAVNAILRSLADALPFNKGDKIMHMNIAYPMVKNVISYISQHRGLKIINVTIPFPLLHGDDDFLIPMRAAFESNPNVKLVSLDHISSYPSAILPISKLVALAHSYGALVLVDGAHALGQIPIDITAIDADFYLANAHKWLYSPKGSAFLWVRPSLQKYISPAVISSEFDEGSLMSTRFAYVGTRNYNAVLAIKAALEFRASLGETAITQYIHTLGWNAANAIVKLWKTSLLVPIESMNGALFSVALPTQNGTIAYRVQAALLKQYDTYVQLGQVIAADSTTLWYIRLSAQIYLQLEDFTTMAQRFLDLMNTVA